jgi:hypothetical protein
MTRAPKRTHFHSSLLVRTLVDMAVLDPAPAATALPEKLGSWISFTDAITLSGMRQDHLAQAQSAVQASNGMALMQEFALARSALEHSIARAGTVSGGLSRMALPSPQAGMSIEEASVYTPYRRYHQNHQRHFEQSVRALRSKVRNVVANSSPRLRQLAMLDASYENILQEREANMLANLPTMFERRFHQLRKAHQTKMAAQQQTDNPDLWTKPGAWLTQFFHDLHAVLLAELDLRLQPTIGLLEALTTETN